MRAAGFSPSSIQTRFGRALEVYSEAVFIGDLEAAANALRVARTDIGVHMAPTEKAAYDKMPGYAVGDSRTRSKVLDDMEARRECLLEVATRHNLYAKAPEEVGDAGTLEEEIPDG